jgi:PAS domain S-box-containing protein
VAAIVEAVTDGFIAFDRDLRFTYVNRRAAEMWGRPVSDLLGRTPKELFPGMDGSPFFALVERVARTGSPDVVEGYATSLHVPIELRAYPLVGGGAVGFFTDLSERRRAEAAATFMAEASRTLASSADYQTTLTNLATAAVPRLGDWCAVDVLTEPDRAAWPPKVERVATIHQDPATRELARAMTTAFPQDWSRDTGTVGVLRTRQPVMVPEVTEAMRVASAKNETHLAMIRQLDIRSVIIVPLVARDRVLGTITLVMSESGRRFGDADLALAVDLGQRAGVALDNARLLRDANAANVAKTEFLRTISHELRQPLNAMQGYLSLWKLGLRGELTSTMQEDIERLSRNQEHLTVLIEDLLSFTRLEAGQLSVERAPVSIAELVASLDAMMRPQMRAQRIEFVCTPCDPAVAALGDQHRIIQICVNLLTNAIRATPPGGRVTLECVPEDKNIAITVADTGSGIPPEQLESIFSPFTQLGRALNAPREGAGLGLAIARGLAEAMGGTLQVASELDRGSVFSLRLPRSDGEPRTISASRS